MAVDRQVSQIIRFFRALFAKSTSLWGKRVQPRFCNGTLTFFWHGRVGVKLHPGNGGLVQNDKNLTRKHLIQQFTQMGWVSAME
jgi:hypothetical protein